MGRHAGRLPARTAAFRAAIRGSVPSGLGIASAELASENTFDWEMVPHSRGLEEIGIFLGLVILVQGFETSRYLGGKYDPLTRVRTMRAHLCMLASSACLHMP